MMTLKEEKFRKTIDENKSRIMRVCRYYAPSREDQKDMYQEILVNIWRSIETFRGDCELSTWIYRISVNTSLSYAGKHYKRMKLNVDIDTCNISGILEDDPDERKLIEEKISDLQFNLNQLSVIDKAIMGLVLEELSYRDIADIIGITEPNVRIKVHRIKETLRSQMKGGSYEKRSKKR
jgi:RNA polymerase sigma-70 factor (ECF subfamily)